MNEFKVFEAFLYCGNSLHIIHFQVKFLNDSYDFRVF
jgi:hypothetical protein